MSLWHIQLLPVCLWDSTQVSPRLGNCFCILHWPEFLFIRTLSQTYLNFIIILRGKWLINLIIPNGKTIFHPFNKHLTNPLCWESEQFPDFYHYALCGCIFMQMDFHLLTDFLTMASLGGNFPGPVGLLTSEGKDCTCCPLDISQLPHLLSWPGLTQPTWGLCADHCRGGSSPDFLIFFLERSWCFYSGNAGAHLPIKVAGEGPS